MRREEISVSKEDVEHMAEAMDLPDPIENADPHLIELEDGSVLINEPPKTPKSGDFYQNLVETLELTELLAIAHKLIDAIEIDKEARKDRDKQYEEGLQRTGLGEPAPGGAYFQGASKVTHPVLAEACVDFAASAAKELIPPSGAVKSFQKSGSATEKTERKIAFLNWQLTEQIEEFYAEIEVLLSQLPLGGSQYLKIWFDSDFERIRVEWLPVDRVYLPFSAQSYRTSPRCTEVETITQEIFDLRVDQGLYAVEDDLYPSDQFDEENLSATEQAAWMIEGKTMPDRNIDQERTIYNVYTWLKIEGDEKTKGERAPYYLMIDVENEKLLGLYRNWEQNDEKRRKLEWIVEFPFIPWRGAFGLGLPHLIGGLAGSATGALRALLDAANNANSQTFVKMKSPGLSGATDVMEPNQVLEIEAPVTVNSVRDLIMPMPFNPPSPVLFELLGWLTNAAKGVVSTSEEKIADMPQNAPATTTLALIEQGAKTYSSIHARLHRSMAQVLKIICRLNHWHLEEMENDSGTPIEVRDFAANDDVRPVSDPNIFSEMQRMQQANACLQIANMNPEDAKLFDRRQLYLHVLKSMKVPYLDEILPSDSGTANINPVLENVKMAMGDPVAAYPGQDHISHMLTHFAFAADPNFGANDIMGNNFAPALLAHTKQHLLLLYMQMVKDGVVNDLGEDIFQLHEEKELPVMAQQAISVTAFEVSQRASELLAGFQENIKQLTERVKKQKEAQQESAVMSDPSAHVLLKTEQAKQETEKARAQLQAEELKNKYQLELEKLQAQVSDLLAKYSQTKLLEDNKNAVAIALADINNSSRERVEKIKAQAAFDQEQLRAQIAQDQAAREASLAAAAELQTHGLEVEKAQLQHESDQQMQTLKQAQEAPLGMPPSAPTPIEPAMAAGGPTPSALASPTSETGQVASALGAGPPATPKATVIAQLLDAERNQ